MVASASLFVSVFGLTAECFFYWPKAQRIHDGQRTRAHGKDIAQNPADAGGGALERLDERRMIVRLDLESAHPAIANVDNPGVFSRPLHHQPAARRQALEMHARGLVGAMLAPHHAEDAQLGDGGRAPQVLEDLLVLLIRDAMLADDFWSDFGCFCHEG